MTHDPYITPEAELKGLQQHEVPKSTLRKIRTGWVAACISGILSLCYMTFLIMSGEVSDPNYGWYFIDPALVLILAYGVYRRSRTAAILLFIFDAIPKIAIAFESDHVATIAIAILYSCLIALGVIGTFKYQRAVNINSNRK